MDFFIFGMHIHIEKILFISIIALIVLISGITGFALSRNDNAIIINKTTEQADTVQATDETKDSESSPKPAEEEKIKVYVVGCVKKPGIIEINKGQIISDAITEAGGPTKDADIFNINMVYKLTENVMLKINKKSYPSVNSEAGNSTGADVAGKGVEIIKETGNAPVIGAGGESEKGGLININTATATELDVLPGIGEKTAADIIAYREKSGGFKKIEEIMNVSRIGQKRFDSLKDLITV